MVALTENPLRIGLQQQRVPEPSIVVFFGASGDLTKRKLIPALYNLAKGDLLSREFAVVGVARSGMTFEAFRQKLTQEIREFATAQVDAGLWEWFAQRLYYIAGDIGDRSTYQELRT
ncbi:MAG: glucose-6-phosphate dehydrogenase, partial [Scytonema sp. CRU_2_7]|nr:glucose-6-phosphate dehydrogenase [Scytonema sp. CRU_2_7]